MQEEQGSQWGGVCIINQDGRLLNFLEQWANFKKYHHDIQDTYNSQTICVNFKNLYAALPFATNPEKV